MNRTIRRPHAEPRGRRSQRLLVSLALLTALAASITVSASASATSLGDGPDPGCATTLETFEDNVGIWNSSRARARSDYSPRGGRSVRLRGPNMTRSSSAIDMSQGATVAVTIRARAMEANDHLYLVAVTDGEWQTIASWSTGDSEHLLSNSEPIRYTVQVPAVGSETVLRFVMDATARYDNVYIDDICVVPVGTPPCTASFVTSDISGNRGDAVQPNRALVALFYDGGQSQQVKVRLGLSDGGFVAIGGSEPGGPLGRFDTVINTREYELSAGCTLSGSYSVEGVVGDGVIDGLAIGILARDGVGNFTMFQSTDAGDAPRANFVGMWPLGGLDHQSFTDRTPQITDPFGREAAKAMIFGAQLVDNGEHHF